MVTFVCLQWDLSRLNVHIAVIGAHENNRHFIVNCIAKRVSISSMRHIKMKAANELKVLPKRRKNDMAPLEQKRELQEDYGIGSRGF